MTSAVSDVPHHVWHPERGERRLASICLVFDVPHPLVTSAVLDETHRVEIPVRGGLRLVSIYLGLAETHPLVTSVVLDELHRVEHPEPGGPHRVELPQRGLRCEIDLYLAVMLAVASHAVVALGQSFVVAVHRGADDRDPDSLLQLFVGLLECRCLIAALAERIAVRVVVGFLDGVDQQFGLRVRGHVQNRGLDDLVPQFGDAGYLSSAGNHHSLALYRAGESHSLALPTGCQGGSWLFFVVTRSKPIEPLFASAHVGAGQVGRFSVGWNAVRFLSHVGIEAAVVGRYEGCFHVGFAGSYSGSWNTPERNLTFLRSH